MKLDQKLIEAAENFIPQRFGDESWAGAATIYTEDGQILISTSPGCVNSSVELCHEAGAICEAYKINKRIKRALIFQYVAAIALVFASYDI